MLENDESQQKKSKKIKERFLIAFFVCIVTGIIGWCLWSGMNGLFFANTHSMEDVFTNAVKGDVYEGDITASSVKYSMITKTIDFVIPVGTEYFYLMYSPELDRAISIRAPKGWDADFDDELMNTISKPGRGIVRELADIEKNALLNAIEDLNEPEIQVESELYLDLLIDRFCYMEIFVALSLTLCSVYYTMQIKRQEEEKGTAIYNNPVAIIVTAIFLLTLGMAIYLLEMVVV